MGNKRFSVTGTQATIAAAVIGLIGTIGAAMIGLSKSSDPDDSPPTTLGGPLSGKATSQVELVDVNATERGPETVILDIKARNTGANVSVLKRAVAHVRNWRILSTCSYGAPLPTSSTYKLKLPIDPPGPQFDVGVDLSDSLRPNEATRIKIETGLDVERPFISGMIFQIQLELQFDRGGSAISDPVILSLPGALWPKGYWRSMMSDSDSGGFEKECARQNLEDLEFMLKLPGRRSPDLEKLTSERP